MMNIRLAFRSLFNTPLVTAIVVISLALGIGGNAAIFSIFEQVLLRALPVQAPDRLVDFGAPGPNPGSQSCNQAGDCQTVFSYPMFRDLERAQASFTGIAAHRLFDANLSYRGQTESGSGMQVSGSYFSVLSLPPALGRLVDASDDRSGGWTGGEPAAWGGPHTARVIGPRTPRPRRDADAPRHYSCRRPPDRLRSVNRIRSRRRPA